MGHVPTGEVPTTREGVDLSRRKHRGAGARRPALTARQLGELGERIAAEYLMGRGFSILGRNVRVGRGEIDLLVGSRTRRVVVEVKSGWSDDRDVDGPDPLLRFDTAKAKQVWSLARRVGADRVDLVAVVFGGTGVQVRWVPAVS